MIGSGGAAILTEIPEIFGAEQLLMARAARRSGVRPHRRAGQRLQALFPRSRPAGFGESLARQYRRRDHHARGEVARRGAEGRARAGRRRLRLWRAGPRRKGLSLLEAPGNDAVSSTALAAAGATLILFTTGRGTPLGFPVPTVKIASNSALAARKPGWIDFDAGSVLADGFEAAAEALTARIAAIASGAQTAAERDGERDIAIWKRGVTL